MALLQFKLVGVYGKNWAQLQLVLLLVCKFGINILSIETDVIAFPFGHSSVLALVEQTIFNTHNKLI